MKRIASLVSAICLSSFLAVLAPGATAAPECTQVGTSGNDRLVGTGGRDVLCGRGGSDLLIGRGGNDLLIGGRGNDGMRGGIGDDTLWGGVGRDFLSADGGGADVLSGQDHNEVCLWTDDGAGNDSIKGGSGVSDRYDADPGDHVSGAEVAEDVCPPLIWSEGGGLVLG